MIIGIVIDEVSIGSRDCRAKRRKSSLSGESSEFTSSRACGIEACATSRLPCGLQGVLDLHPDVFPIRRSPFRVGFEHAALQVAALREFFRCRAKLTSRKRDSGTEGLAINGRLNATASWNMEMSRKPTLIPQKPPECRVASLGIAEYYDSITVASAL